MNEYLRKGIIIYISVSLLGIVLGYVYHVYHRPVRRIIVIEVKTNFLPYNPHPRPTKTEIARSI